jgi:hypothetical protein
LNTTFEAISKGAGYIYSFWVNVALWQCAFNTKSKITAYLTRFGVMIGVLFSCISLLFDQFGTSLIPTDASTQAETEALTRILELLR